MTWPLLAAREGLKKIKETVPAIDVRSPHEFAIGSILGFTNIAILNNQHRHQVGLTYKREGNLKAVELGLRLVTPLRDELVEGWRKAFAGREGLVTCWRGGQRSAIAADWMQIAGLRGCRIEGGYKALRHVLLEEIARPREWIVVEGLTGSGKSELLRRLDSSIVLDLENLAAHRGSAFGGFLDKPQPSQQTFENAVGLKLFERFGKIVVEDESAMIGRCALPAPLRQAILQAPLVRVVASMEERVARVFAEYVSEPVRRHGVEDVRASLLDSIRRISDALGGLRARELSTMIGEAFASEVNLDSHRPWIETLLRGYYDPRYEFSLKRDERKVLFEGDLQAAFLYVQSS